MKAVIREKEGMVMIETVNLTKRFDDIVAVDHIAPRLRLEAYLD